MKRAILALAFVVTGSIAVWSTCGPGGDGIKKLVCNKDASSCCVRFCDGSGGCF